MPAAYRLDDLVRRSGVSSRNIRSYQERGLLKPPFREGRLAIYDESHVGQLKAITQLLQRGYTISHIQAFFEGFAKKLELADILGVQELAEKTDLQNAVFAPWDEDKPDTNGSPGPAPPLRLDTSSELARRLVDQDIARLEDDRLFIIDKGIADLVAHAKDETFYLRVLDGAYNATKDAVRRLAETTVEELRNKLVEHYGEGWIPPVERHEEIAAAITATRQLGAQMINIMLNAELNTNTVRVLTEHFETIMANSGNPELIQLVRKVRQIASDRSRSGPKTE